MRNKKEGIDSSKLEIREERCVSAYPWQRFFARYTDQNLYFLIWVAIAYLLLHWNLSNLSNFEWIVSALFITFGMMILIEPFMLKIFGTTFGKAIFGIHVKDVYGCNLTLRKGYKRVLNVFIYGYGCSIPIYNLIVLHKNYKICRDHGCMSWDLHEEIQYTINRKFLPLRAAVFILTITIFIFANNIIPFAADMPKYRGELTIEQFHANVERYARFHGMVSKDGQPLRESPPKLNIIEINGIVNEIGFEIVEGHIGDVWGLQHWIRAYIVSFVGAQERVNFWSLHIADGNPLNEFFPLFWVGWVHSSHSHTAYGIDMIYSFENNTDGTVTAIFNMRSLR